MTTGGARFRRAAKHPQLRKIEMAYAAFNLAEHATWLAITVYAFRRGGVNEASLVAIVQLIPATFIAPFTAFAGDRFAPNRALTVGYLTQSVALGATAAFMAGGMPIAAYVATTVAAVAMTVTRPVMGSILPRVTHTPRDLIAANVVSSLTEQLGACLGPLAGGFMIAAASPALPYAIGAGGLFLGALAVVRVDVERMEPESMKASQVLHEVLGGYRALRTEPISRWLIATVSVGVFSVGVLDIVIVTFASTDLGGDRDAGFLQTAVGLGALIGTGVGTGLVGGTRILRYLIGSTVLLSTPFVLLDLVGSRGVALVLFAVVGTGMSLTRFVGSVAMQRLAPFHVLTRIFGVLEAMTMICLALGAIVVARLISATSLAQGSAIIGIAIGLALVVCMIRLHRLGATGAPPPAELFDRIADDPLFAALPAPTVERLAAAARTRQADPGEAIITEGELGDDYFLIVAGTVEITMGAIRIRSMSVGESFGEIALLRECPRTATATAADAVTLYSIDSETFLHAVTGHPRSIAEAERITTRFLGDA